MNIRQSDITKVLFPFFSSLDDMEERIQDGIQEHERFQEKTLDLDETNQWWAERRMVSHLGDLTLIGHLDLTRGTSVTELKFTRSEKFTLYDSYVFQIWFYAYLMYANDQHSTEQTLYVVNHYTANTITKFGVLRRFVFSGEDLALFEYRLTYSILPLFFKLKAYSDLRYYVHTRDELKVLKKLLKDDLFSKERDVYIRDSDVQMITEVSSELDYGLSGRVSF